MAANKSTPGLLNYTTKIDASVTIGEIQRVLTRQGAKSIQTDYSDDGEPERLAFLINTAFGPRTFILPAHVDRVLAVLLRKRGPSHVTRPDRAQAVRVAWRVIKDWIDAQLALIETEMVSLDQVMLPYLQVDDGVSLYDAMKDRQLMLTSGPAVRALPAARER